MFIGYNKARRSGLPVKDFLAGAFLLNALRIRVLQPSGPFLSNNDIDQHSSLSG
jgi:hypothetical protein